MNPQVIVVPTPNPDALMFKVEEALVHAGTYEGRKGEDLSQLPLASALLEHEGTILALIAPRFVTVRKDPDASWNQLRPILVQEILQFLSSGEMAVIDEAAVVEHSATSLVEQRILDLIDSEIRPAIAMDGGDVVYLGFDQGVVRLRLQGACGNCPSALTTLKMGIERLLVEEIPEVLSVVQDPIEESLLL
jgi:Fe-S cluster biogenesis protein NfuA